MRFILTILFFAAFIFQSHGQSTIEIEINKKYQENILKEEINGTYIPMDMDEAMLELDKLSSPDSKSKIIAGEEAIVTKRLTNGLGKWMIVHWSFVEGSRLSHSIRQMGVTHPEDMSAFIIGSYYRYLKGDPLDLDSRAETFYNKRKMEQHERNRSKKIIRTN